MPNEASDLKQNTGPSRLARSASYEHIPSPGSSHDNSTVDVKRTLSEVNLPHAAELQKPPDCDGFTTGKEILRRSSLRSSKEKSRKPSEDVTEQATSSAHIPSHDLGGRNSSKSAEPPPQPPRSKPGAFASLTRKKWLSSSASRTPSPPVQEKSGKSRPNEDSSRRPNQEDGWAAESKPQDDASPKRKARRPLSAFSGKSKNASSATLSRSPSLQSLRRRASSDRMTASVGSSEKDVPPVPQAPKNPGRLSKVAEVHRKKDELWTVFRGLDADYQKYAFFESPVVQNCGLSS